MNCTVAMEMRRRGYDVIARSKAQGVKVLSYQDWFKDVSFNRPISEPEAGESRKSYANRVYNNMCNEIEKLGNGARGYITTTYESPIGTMTSNGHSMFWEVNGNKVEFWDPQQGNNKTDKVFALSHPNGYMWGRLDNLQLKPQVTETIRSSPDKKKVKK